MFQTLCDEGLGWQPTGPEQIQRWQDGLVARGVPPETAEREIRRELQRDFAGKGRQYHTVVPSTLVFSYGVVDEA